MPLLYRASPETSGQPSATWTFDISGYSDLELNVDLGAHASASSGGFPLSALITFTYQIDAGPVQTAFSIAPNGNFGGYNYRPMDSGLVSAVGTNGPLEVTGPNAVTKTLADTGGTATNTFLDKTPPSGAGAGLMDTFTTALNGTGSQLTLTMTANLDFEAMGFDNIAITGIPEPASISLLLVGLSAFVARRRR
jgi:hypothetical protein